jgi:hypothetical protein
MSRIRLILLSLGAVAATAVVGVFATASASAITPVFLVCLEKSGSGIKYEDRNCSKESGSGKFELVEVTSALEFNGTSGVATLKSKLLGAEIRITCQKDITTGEIEAKGLSLGTDLFDECTVGNSKETFVNCEVPSIQVNFRDQLILNSKDEVEDEYAPKEGEDFTSISIKNKSEKPCTEKGTFPVKGTQDAEIEQPSTGAKLLRNFKFSFSGSKLTFNGETAEFENKVSIDLNNDDSWGVSVP